MSIRAIVLAAGKGTRMKSSTAKVLHELCGRPMLWFVLSALRKAGVEDILVVTNSELQDRMREFGVSTPDGHRITIGQIISSAGSR